MAALPSRPLLTASDILTEMNTGGLIVVGSYVPKSTAQLEDLLANTQVKGIELPVAQMLQESERTTLVDEKVKELNECLSKPEDVVLYTSRKLVSGKGKEDSLRIGSQISLCLTEIVARLQIRPRYLIAKGGITSSDLATKALKVKKAMVMGQLLPGIPVWELGPESKYPGMAYVVFPGNVGNLEALTQMVQTMARRHGA